MVPEDLKKKYFTQVGPSYKIADEIKARVEFKEHNLLKDQYPTDYHFIVCRNVLIYFTEEAKDEVFRKYFRSLAKGGILFIGSTERRLSITRKSGLIVRIRSFTRNHRTAYQKRNPVRVPLFLEVFSF